MSRLICAGAYALMILVMLAMFAYETGRARDKLTAGEWLLVTALFSVWPLLIVGHLVQKSHDALYAAGARAAQREHEAATARAEDAS